MEEEREAVEASHDSIVGFTIHGIAYFLDVNLPQLRFCSSFQPEQQKQFFKDILPELSNSGSKPPAEPGVYSGEIIFCLRYALN